MNPKRKFAFHSERTGTALTIQVLPNARKSKISDIRSDGCVVIRLASDSFTEICHPTLINFLAKLFSVEEAKIEIIAGGMDQYKIVSILGIGSNRADEILRSKIK